MLRTRRLIVVAACVRATYLAVALVATALLRDYDTSAPLTTEDCADSAWPEAVAAAIAARAPPSTGRGWPLPPAASLGGRAARLGVVWDALFYQRIAACGYEYEQYLAFFPGLPRACVRGMGAGAAPRAPQPPPRRSPLRRTINAATAVLVRALRGSQLLPAAWGFGGTALLLNIVLFLASTLLLARCAATPSPVLAALPEGEAQSAPWPCCPTVLHTSPASHASRASAAAAVRPGWGLRCCRTTAPPRLPRSCLC